MRSNPDLERDRPKRLILCSGCILYTAVPMYVYTTAVLRAESAIGPTGREVDYVRMHHVVYA